MLPLQNLARVIQNVRRFAWEHGVLVIRHEDILSYQTNNQWWMGLCIFQKNVAPQPCDDDKVAAISRMMLIFEVQRYFTRCRWACEWCPISGTNNNEVTWALTWLQSPTTPLLNNSLLWLISRELQRSELLIPCEGNLRVTDRFPSKTDSNALNVSMSWRYHAITTFEKIVTRHFQKHRFALISVRCHEYLQGAVHTCMPRYNTKSDWSVQWPIDLIRQACCSSFAIWSTDARVIKCNASSHRVYLSVSAKTRTLISTYLITMCTI